MEAADGTPARRHQACACHGHGCQQLHGWSTGSVCVADACVTDDASGPAQEGKDEPRKSKANVRRQHPLHHQHLHRLLQGELKPRPRATTAA
uniref:Uncharacterized protein n=1 Tax=Zea mays TaxID=4577 RepID=B6U6F2_MAIZE|nr:hypothetical protein [Zea mays]